MSYHSRSKKSNRIRWSVKTHFKFSKEKRSYVIFILWLAKLLGVPKDIWIYGIIPKTLAILSPTYLITNLDFHLTVDSLSDALTEQGILNPHSVLICARKGGMSKGFGFFKVDDENPLARTEFKLNGRIVKVQKCRDAPEEAIFD